MPVAQGGLSSGIRRIGRTTGAATGPFTVRFTFSAAVRNFATGRIAIRNGDVGGATLTRLSDTVYTLVVTPTANFKGVGEVQVLAGAFQDATGAVTSAQAYSFGQQIDTVVISTEPTLAITHNVTGTLATAAVTFTFTFSADVGDSFTAADIQLTAGTLGTVTRSSGTVYTAIVTLPAGTQGLLIVFVDANSFQTPAGAANQQQYSKLVQFAIPT